MRDTLYLSLCIVFIVLLELLTSPSQAQSADAGKAHQTAPDGITLYLEALTKLRSHALRPRTDQQIVRDTLKAYLRSLDPFSDYLSPAEYANFRRLQQSQYVGVGMDIMQQQSGDIVCIPYPDSPAAHAGIVIGDVLRAVDGMPLGGQSVLTVGPRIRGQGGSSVRLRVARKGAEEQDIVIVRVALQAKSVFVEQHEAFPIVRLLSFTERTAHELAETLRTLPPSVAVVVDLRGNTGGSLQEAIDAAMLFLDNGKKVVTLKTQDGSKIYYRQQSAHPVTVPLYLWQDAWTASAAEVFIAALQQNQRAISIGKKTFGKGMMQQVFELTDGSALYLTTGSLQTPDGTAYHNQGLQPTYPLATIESQTQDYVAQVVALLKQR